MKVLSYACPFSRNFNSCEIFNRDLTTRQKIKTIFATVIAALLTLPLLGVGGLIAFRLMTEKYKITLIVSKDEEFEVVKNKRAFKDVEVEFVENKRTFKEVETEFVENKRAFKDVEVEFVENKKTFKDVEVETVENKRAFKDVEVEFVENKKTFKEVEVEKVENKRVTKEVESIVVRKYTLIEVVEVTNKVSQAQQIAQPVGKKVAEIPQVAVVPDMVAQKAQVLRVHKELAEEGFVNLADPTPSSARTAWDQLDNIRMIGQLALGNYEPIITIILDKMPEDTKQKFFMIVNSFDKIRFTLEAHKADERKILDSFQQFQDKQDWSSVAGKEGVSAIENYQVFFWFYVTHLIDTDWKTRMDPVAIRQLQKISDLARKQSQEILRKKINPEQTIARVEMRPMGDISPKEKDWIKKRLVGVLNSQKKLFKDENLTEPLNIGLCFSGGGYRAAILTAGYLTALQKMGIVDSSLYVSGLSGSTWFLVPWLLSNEKNPERTKEMLKEIIPQANIPNFLSNMHKLDIPRFMHDVILPKAVCGKPISSVDFYGGLLARALLINHQDGRHELTMNDIAKRIETAQFPFPICTAISPPAEGSNAERYTWWEFNAFEAEDDKGCSIPAYSFGSRFNQGTADIISHEKIGSLMGMFGSAYTLDFTGQIDKALIGGIKSTFANGIAKVCLPKGSYIKGRVSPASAHNPCYNFHPVGLSQEHANHVAQQEFNTFNDAGIHFNLPLTTLLKRARNLDVIIVGDASAGEITTEEFMPDGITLCPAELAKFFKEVHGHEISYSRKEFKDDALNFSIYEPTTQNRKPVWIEGEKLPIIIYFNFNTDKKMIADSMQNEELRPLIEEHNLAEYNAEECLNGYGNTFNFEYQQREYDQLAAVAEFNMRSREGALLNVLNETRLSKASKVTK